MSETQPSEDRTIHDRRKNRTSQLPTKATRINETPTPSIPYIVIGTSTAKRSNEDDDEYEVEKILKRKRANGQPFYLVR